MVVNEVTEILFNPLGSIIAAEIWGVIEETKLYLVPFILYAWFAVNEARGAGAEAGSPSIQTFRKIESRYIAMFAVMIFAGKPMFFTSSVDDIRYVSYSCSAEGLGIGSITEDDIRQSSYSTGMADFNPTLWSGLMNTFSTGLTNASIAAIPCEKTGSYRSALSEQTVAVVDKPSTVDLIKEYDSQCYIKGMDRISKLAQTEPNLNLSDVSYNGAALHMVYPGINQKGMTETMLASISKDTLTPPTNANVSIFGNYDKACDELGDHLEINLLYEAQHGSHSKAFIRTSGDKISLTDDEARFAANILYQNTLSDAASTMTIAKNMLTDTFERYAASYAGATYLGIGTSILEKGEEQGYAAAVGNSLRSSIGGLAMYMGSAFESVKIYQYQQGAPIVIAAVKLALIVSVPVMLLLSGFNGKLLMTLTIGLFSFEYAKFFLELGMYLDELINEMILLAGGNYADSSTALQNSGLLTYLSLIVQYSLIGIWFVFVGWLGVKTFGALTMLESAGKAAGDNTKALANTVTQGKGKGK